MFVQRLIPFREAFDLENPKLIDKDDYITRSYGRAALVEWLDDTLVKNIYNKPCPTECLRRIKAFLEPRSDYKKRKIGDIFSLKYHPRGDFNEFVKQFEDLNRTLQINCRWWNDTLMLDAFLLGIRAVLPNVDLKLKDLKQDHRMKNVSKNDLDRIYYEEAGLGKILKNVIRITNHFVLFGKRINFFNDIKCIKN